MTLTLILTVLGIVLGIYAGAGMFWLFAEFCAWVADRRYKNQRYRRFRQ
jgi:hypothetical protein